MAGIFARNSPGGIFGGRRTRRLEAEAEQSRLETVEGIDVGVDELIANTADPAEAAMWRDSFESYKELAMSQDPIQQREGIAGLGKMHSDVIAAIDRRHTAQEGFIVEHARELREQHLKAIEPMRKLQSNMEQFDALLSDPDFEQNLPINRGTLTALLESTTRQMLSDPEDFADALIGAGGAGLIGTLVNFAGGALAAKDFDFKKEDYATLARASYRYNSKRYQNTVAPLELQAAALDEAAAGLDFLPRGYSLTQYVTGPPETFTDPLKERYAEPAEKLPGQADSALGALGNLLGGGGESGGDPERATDGEPFAGVTERDGGWLERLTGVFDIGEQLNAQIAASSSAGGTVRADPKTGALFVTMPDGTREELPTSVVKRTYVRNALQRQSGEAARNARRNAPATENVNGLPVSPRDGTAGGVYVPQFMRRKGGGR